MKLTTQLTLLLLILAISSCEVINTWDSEPVGIVEGVKPIYAAIDTWDRIETKPPQPISNLGKIYYKEPYIYVNERNAGIHVMDNSDPTNPIPVKFIEVIGSEDIAIKGDILYVDNISDLVAIDISDFENIQVTSRVKDLYMESKKSYPDGYNGFFECVDASKGVIIGWEAATLDNPTCFR